MEVVSTDLGGHLGGCHLNEAVGGDLPLQHPSPQLWVAGITQVVRQAAHLLPVFLICACSITSSWVNGGRKEKFSVLSDRNRSLLRRQPRAMTIGHSPKALTLFLYIIGWERRSSAA